MQKKGGADTTSSSNKITSLTTNSSNETASPTNNASNETTSVNYQHCHHKIK